ncbi:hypothetical protein EPI10_006680 [Gossypium australe]|uniref:Uncharacterized protein n=1 Tax=Gossypium australe TaxID=47621 RepID=A0A5B6WTI6_9ROSI|nr:hypothetical protein EPI10_006680 [Gossypium australe]
MCVCNGLILSYDTFFDVSKFLTCASAQEGNVRRKVRRNRTCTYMNVESWPEWSELLDLEKKPFKQKMTTERVEYKK